MGHADGVGRGPPVGQVLETTWRLQMQRGNKRARAKKGGTQKGRRHGLFKHCRLQACGDGSVYCIVW